MYVASCVLVPCELNSLLICCIVESLVEKLIVLHSHAMCMSDFVSVRTITLVVPMHLDIPVLHLSRYQHTGMDYILQVTKITSIPSNTTSEMYVLSIHCHICASYAGQV